jgi:hypothetical protein
VEGTATSVAGNESLTSLSISVPLLYREKPTTHALRVSGSAASLIFLPRSVSACLRSDISFPTLVLMSISACFRSAISRSSLAFTSSMACFNFASNSLRTSASSFCSSPIFVWASLSLSLRHFIPSLVGCRPHGGYGWGLAPRGSLPNASAIASIANAESKRFMISLPINFKSIVNILALPGDRHSLKAGDSFIKR